MHAFKVDSVEKMRGKHEDCRNLHIIGLYLVIPTNVILDETATCLEFHVSHFYVGASGAPSWYIYMHIYCPPLRFCNNIGETKHVKCVLI